MTTDQDIKASASSYLEYLPAIYQLAADSNRVAFLGKFLLAFETILSGFNKLDKETRDKEFDDISFSNLEGLEEKVDKIHTYFDPGQTPPEFLRWLAGWLALNLRDDWDEKNKRDIVRNIAALCRKRGTLQGIYEAIQTFTKANLKWNKALEVDVDELDTPFQIGIHSTVGKDTWLGGGPPHFFRVTVDLNSRDPDLIRRHHEVIAGIIDLEKPAHTCYELELKTPTMIVGKISTVGKDTLLGKSKYTDTG